MSEEKSPACCSNGGQKTAIIIVGLVLLTAIIISAILRDRLVNQQFKSVTVVGQGKVTYVPDLALVTLGVQIDKAAKPADALTQLNAKVAGIIKGVKAVSVSAGDIQTQNYSLYPQYDYKNNVSVVTGYNANEQLVIKVEGYDKDQNKLNRVIAAASAAGANQVNSLSFDSSQMNDLKQQARLLALADAKAKSSALASAAGVQLSDITGWYENLINPSTSADTNASDAKGGAGGGGNDGGTAVPQTPSGNQEVVIEIGLTYNLK
jgi:uncharacterized protein YggE